MKNYEVTTFIIIGLLATLITVGCQPSESQPAQQEIKPEQGVPETPLKVPEEIPSQETAVPGDASKVVFIKDSHDFGKIGPGSANKAEFVFKNEGTATLLVNRLQSTCGCSKPTLIKDGKRYDAKLPLKPAVAFEPGESGQIEVTFKAPVTKGKVEKSLYILSNDPSTPRARFAVKAEVVVKVSVQPEKVDLKLDIENAGMPDIVVKSIDGQEFSIKSASVAQKTIKIPFDPAAKATEFVLKPEVDMDKIGNLKTGVIQIKTTHPQAGTLMVRYTVKPTYEVSNPRYILQNIKPGEPIVRDNLIRSNYGKQVEIESVKSRNGYMEIGKQEPDGDHMKLSIKITPPEQAASARRYITDELTITLKDGNKLTIRCSGWFRLK